MSKDIPKWQEKIPIKKLYYIIQLDGQELRKISIGKYYNFSICYKDNMIQEDKPFYAICQDDGIIHKMVRVKDHYSTVNLSREESLTVRGLILELFFDFPLQDSLIP